MHLRIATTQCEGPTCREWSWFNRGTRPGDINERIHCGPHHRGPPPRPNCGPHHRGPSHCHVECANFRETQHFGQTDYPIDDDERTCCGPPHHGHERPHLGPHFRAYPNFGAFDRFASTSHFGPEPHYMGTMMSHLRHEQFHRGWPHHHHALWETRSCHRHHEHRCGHHRRANNDRNN